MKKFKKVIPIIIAFIIGISTTVTAATVFNSKDITYSSDKTTKINVKDSLDELYEKVGKCPEGHYCYTEPVGLSDKVELGDYISMTPANISYTISKELTGYDKDQTIKPNELSLWRVTKTFGDGTIEVVSEHVTNKIFIVGDKGYLNYVGLLNQIAAQFEIPAYVINSHSIGTGNNKEFCNSLYVFECQINDGSHNSDNFYSTKSGIPTAGLTIDGENVGYFYGARRFVEKDGVYIWSITYRSINDEIVGNEIYNSNGGSHSYGYGVRPILNLKSNIEIISGDGKSPSTAYKFK